MKAALLSEYHRPLEIVERPEPEPVGSRDVVVRIGGAGVCATDLHAQDGLMEAARHRLGRHVFAVGGAKVETGFPEAVARVLGDAGMTLAAAEEASSGALARFMGASAAGRRVYLGGLVAARPEVLGARLDSADVTAESAAEAIRLRFGSSIGVAALGSADGGDGRRAGALVVAAAGPSGVLSKQLFFPIDHERFQRLAAYAALRLAERVAGGLTRSG